MAKELQRIEIERSENGGHTVRHHFKPTMRKSRDAHAGMMHTMEEPESHVFGPKDGHEMLAHVANHLHIPNEGPKESEGNEEE